MKRTEIKADLRDFPEELHGILSGGRIYDSSCSPEARVYFADTQGGLYLKRANKGELRAEAELTEYFHKKGIGAPEVIKYLSLGQDWLLTARVPGEDCTHADYLADPVRLCDLIATRLRELHETDTSDCPADDHLSDFLNTAERNYRAGTYDKSQFPDSWGYESPNAAWSALQEGKSLLRRSVLLHGDYCLPNIMLDSWRFSGFIDLGGAGVGDRHVDLFWGAWSLFFNLGTDEYRERFLDAYGRDVIDPEALRTVAAAEVFR